MPGTPVTARQVMRQFSSSVPGQTIAQTQWKVAGMYEQSTPPDMTPAHPE